jgi:hypothetical protein
VLLFRGGGVREEGAAGVEVELAVVAPVPSPLAAAGLHAAVAPERRAAGDGGHQLELVREVSLVGDLARRVLARISS